MRHGMANKKLNRTSEHRKALLKNMLNSLIKYEQIITTLPKAKELKPQIDKVITIGKKNILSNKKKLFSKRFNVNLLSGSATSLRAKIISSGSKSKQEQTAIAAAAFKALCSPKPLNSQDNVFEFVLSLKEVLFPFKSIVVSCTQKSESGLIPNEITLWAFVFLTQ